MPNRPSDVSFSSPVVGARDDPSRREMVETSWLRYATDTDDSDGTIQAPPREYEEYAEDGRHEEPHRSAGFWDPRMDKVRREVVTNWLRTR